MIGTDGGDIRRLGSTCAGLALRGSELHEKNTNEASFVRREKAIEKAKRWISDGVSTARVLNWLRCNVRGCELVGSSIVIDGRPIF